MTLIYYAGGLLEGNTKNFSFQGVKEKKEATAPAAVAVLK
jgi:hypothetical protein